MKPNENISSLTTNKGVEVCIFVADSIERRIASMMETTRGTSGNSLYGCIVCGKSFGHEKTNCQNHIEAKHLQMRWRYRCQLCGKPFKTKNSLAAHKSRYHRTCQYCGLSGLNKDALAAHILQCHGGLEKQ